MLNFFCVIVNNSISVQTCPVSCISDREGCECVDYHECEEMSMGLGSAEHVLVEQVVACKEDSEGLKVY